MPERPGSDVAALRALGQAWATLNGTLFRGAMRPAALDLGDSKKRLGSWTRTTRTLRISRTFVLERPWPEVVEVLKHEMAHQYVDEVLKVVDETAHGAAFQKVCAEIGADARAAGTVGPSDEPQAVRKVRKLMALANSPNVHEAQAAAQAAHRWMRKHNIDTLDVSSHFASSVVGRATTRHMAHERALAGLLGRHFFVRPIWVPAWLPDRDKWGKVLELSGRPENLAMADHVHQFVLQTAERLWWEHQKRTGAAGRARGRFLVGVVVGFGEQLDGHAARCEEEGLVWVGDAGLEDWVGRRYPRLRTGRSIRVRNDDAWTSGKASGRKLVLRKPVRDKGSRRSGLALTKRS